MRDKYTGFPWTIAVAGLAGSIAFFAYIIPEVLEKKIEILNYISYVMGGIALIAYILYTFQSIKQGAIYIIGEVGDGFLCYKDKQPKAFWTAVVIHLSLGFWLLGVGLLKFIF